MGGSPSADQLLDALSAMLSAHDAVLALNARDLRGTLGLLCQLMLQVAAAWRQAGGTNPNDLLASHEAAPTEVVAALTVPPAAAAAATGAADAATEAGGAEAAAPVAAAGEVLSPEQAASVAALRERQKAALEELSDAADVLRFWSRRSEKAAAGAPASGREGDVPPMMAQVGGGGAGDGGPRGAGFKRAGLERK